MFKSVFSATCACVFLLTTSSSAWAISITFSGAISDGAGVIGHNLVDRSQTAPGAAAYSAVGVQGVYTSLTGTDAFDYTNGGVLGFGANVPTNPYGATAAAPHGFEPFGLLGNLHISSLGFDLDYTNSSDLFFIDATTEQRIYRNGSWKIFEEVMPGTFNEVASYSDMVSNFQIDYQTGVISGTFSGTKDSGNAALPETFDFLAFDPVDVAGSTTDGIFGQFSINITAEAMTASVDEPVMVLLLSLGLIGVLSTSRRKV